MRQRVPTKPRALSTKKSSSSSEVVSGPLPRGKLTDEIIDEFCELLRVGLPTDGACDFIGITNTTYYRWLRLGEDFIKGNGEPKENAIYGKFVMSMRKALATYRLERTRRLHRSKNQNWYRELAILERRDRNTWGRHEPAGGYDEEFNPDERFL